MQLGIRNIVLSRRFNDWGDGSDHIRTMGSVVCDTSQTGLNWAFSNKTSVNMGDLQHFMPKGT
jgi:hypothetical protein